jgi:hypothetical protein
MIAAPSKPGPAVEGNGKSDVGNEVAGEAVVAGGDATEVLTPLPSLLHGKFDPYSIGIIDVTPPCCP